jgi:hypothetical protein
MGTFCDAGCTAIFDATLVKITYHGNVILEGTRVPLGLWKTQVQVTTPAAWQGEANGVFTRQIRTNTIKFLHAACFIPTTQTWTQAIAHGHFRSILDLKVKAVRQLLPKSIATTLVHLDQQQQNWQSTKVHKKKKRPSDKEVVQFDDDTHPAMESPSHDAMAEIVELLDDATGKLYWDLTRQFPTVSKMGNLYVLVLYTQDDNAILVEPLKTGVKQNS